MSLNFLMFSHQSIVKIDFNDKVLVTPTLTKRSRGLPYDIAKETFATARINDDCTFDPRSQRQYRFNIDASIGNQDTVDFYKSFSRNNNKIHLIARTDNRTGKLSETPKGSKTDNKTPYQDIQTELLPPFFGRHFDTDYEDVCIDTIYIETSKTTDSALETAIGHEQASILEITKTYNSYEKRIEHLNKKSSAWEVFARSAGWTGF